MSRTCLVTVFGPHNIIGMLAAVEHYGSIKNDSSVPQIITVVHNPGLSDDENMECGDTIWEMIKPFGWAQPVVLTNATVKTITHHALLKGSDRMIEKFRKIIGCDHVDEVYFCHNLVGKVSDLCLQAYPSATRITTGEGTGQVYDAGYLTFLNKNSEKSLRQRVSNIVHSVQKFASRPLPTPLGPETKIVAMLPTDWNGKFSENKTIIIVPRELVKNILTRCLAGQKDLLEYCRSILNSSNPPRFILILSCWSAGGFMDLEAEIAMNLEIVHAHIPKGSTIIIKPHPFSKSPLTQGVLNRIKNEYDVRVVPDEFKRYPLELIQPLCESCEIIAFSTIVLSLDFLFGKKVINPMNEELMKKFIDSRMRYSIEDSWQWLTGSVENLPAWNGKSLLWSGKK